MVDSCIEGASARERSSDSAGCRVRVERSGGERCSEGGCLKPQLDTARRRVPASGELYRARPRVPHRAGRALARLPAMERVMARKMWRTLEPYHGLIYFAPEAAEAYAALGIHGLRRLLRVPCRPPWARCPRRSSSPRSSTSTRSVVHHAIPAAWAAAPPERIVAARLAAAEAALRRTVGDVLDGPEVARAAALARAAAEACPPAGPPAVRGPRRAGVAGRAPARAVARHHAAAGVPRRRSRRLPRRGGARRGRGARAPRRIGRGAAGRAAGQPPVERRRVGRRGGTDLAGRGVVDATARSRRPARRSGRTIEDRTDELALAPWRGHRRGPRATSCARSCVRSAGPWWNMVAYPSAGRPPAP